jgi:hypothetical protein
VSRPHIPDDSLHEAYTHSRTVAIAAPPPRTEPWPSNYFFHIFKRMHLPMYGTSIYLRDFHVCLRRNFQWQGG